MNLEIKLFTSYLLKFKLITKPLFITITVPTVALTVISDSTQAIYYLLGALLIDFITGVGASYWTEKIKKPNVKIREVIRSEKLRKSMIKTAAYIFIIIAVFKLEKLLMLKPIQFQSVSNAHFTFTFITIGLCISIELWSIFMENLPKCGFDLVSRLRSVFMGVKNIKNEISE